MNYFSFLLKSTNHHGVHSPYVYNYLTKGLYIPEKKFKNTKRTTRFLLKTIHYFRPKHLNISDTIPEKKQLETFSYDRNGIPQLWIMRYEELQIRIAQDFIRSLVNDDLMIIDLRNSDKNILEDFIFHHFTVVLHFYDFIVLSQRKEQQKELFFLRY